MSKKTKPKSHYRNGTFFSWLTLSTWKEFLIFCFEPIFNRNKTKQQIELNSKLKFATFKLAKQSALAFTALLIFTSLLFFNINSANSQTAQYWDNTGETALNFAGLPDETGVCNATVVPFKQFVIDNGTGTAFSLNVKYKDEGGNFNPTSCTIMLEDAADLYSWSEKCYFKYPTASDPTIERSIYLSAHYVLGNNIDYGATARMIPIGFAGLFDQSLRFTGTFDGQGFEVSNLQLTYNSTYFIDEGSQNCYYYSMFSNIGTGGTVKNLGLIAPYYVEANGVNLSLKFGGIAGYNRGTVSHCFVQTGSNRFTSVNAGEIAGVVHTNTGTVDNVYFAGGIYNNANNASTVYNPVVFYNDSGAGGIISNAYYDSTVYDTTVNTTYASVVAKTTALLQNRTSILQDDEWYTDNYNKNITGYVVGYPRLQGFKYNNAVNNSTTNPYYLARPADLIFFSNANNLYTTFGNSNSRYFRLRNCIDMSTVSSYAYTTPLNNFYANFEGTIDDGNASCVSHHVGTGDQLSCHSIINLRLAKPVTKLIGTTQYILMGLVFNDTANACSFKNLSIVGGSVTLPSQLESDAYNNYYNIGTVVSFSRYVNLTNVHNSADVLATGDNDYICKLRMGGLVGGASYTINAVECSNNGTIDGGTHQYTASTSNITSAVGGLIGTEENNGGTKQFIDCANFGSITGVSITANTNTGTVGSSYVGGIGGYIASNNYPLDRVFNSGSIISVKKLPLTGAVYPINAYFAGGLFGNGPAGPSAVPTTDTRMCNKGTIYANKTSNTTVNASTSSANVAGIAATIGNSTYPYKGVGNAGNIIIAKDILTVFAAGITNGGSSLTGCYNDGNFLTEDNAPLSPVNEVRVFGISGGNNGTSTYLLNNCYNNKDINLSFANVTVASNIRVAGLDYNMRVDNSQNYGNITVDCTSVTGTVTVCGVSDSTTSATSTINSGLVTVNALDLSSNLFAAGITAGTGSNGSLTSCVNSGNVTVKRTNKNDATANKYTYLAGVRIGRTSNNTDSITDCENYGEVACDYFYTEDATDTAKAINSNVYMAGVQLYVLNANRCVNHGDVVLAKTTDFTGTNAYVSGVLYSAYSNNNSNVIQNCRNFGNIYNQNNIGISSNTRTRTMIFNGIIYYSSPNMSRCVNQGDITVTSHDTSNNTNLYVNGIMHYTGNIESNRVDYGVTGLSNMGSLKVDHSATALPASSRVFISGIVCQPGTGNITYSGTLPFKNLVNGGKITALVNTDNSINYSTPGTNSFTASSANVTVGGISAMAAYNSNNSSTENIPLSDCANAADINVDLKCAAASPSQKINYNVGGIAANSASNSAGFTNQKLNIYNCVNGGNITVDTVNTALSSQISGVGGILGFGYQYTNGVTTATESNVNSSVYNCINYGTIKGGYSTGGIVGCDGAVLKNNMNFGTIYGTENSSAGGIVGAVRSALKGNNTRMIYAIDGAINYGSVLAAPSETPTALGAIIGNLNIGQDTTYGNRRYANIINSASLNFIGTMVAQSTNNTFGTGTLVDVSTPTFNAPVAESSNAFFKNNIIYKTSGPITDSTSIYYKDTVTDANSFFLRVGEDLPENNSCFVYLDPSQSKRNTYNAGTYSPYPDGIYALSTFEGKKSGYYPSSNVILPNCDPVLISGLGYTDWRNNILGTNTASLVTTMDNFRQIKLNTGNDIISLQLTSGGGTPTTLRNGQLDTTNSKVIFYVVKDNFTPATYIPDLYSANTVLSDKASFDGNTSLDMTSGFTFATAEKYTFTLTVKAEDGNTKLWTVEINSIPAASPLTLTSIKEGVNIENNTASPALHTYTSSDAYNYTLDSTVSCTHNNTLILNFNTTGLLPGKNTINDVSMQTAAGAVVSPGVSSGGIGASNTTYYKVLPTGSYGVTSYNYKVISNDYINYTGTLTVNVRLHSNLNSGTYKILINTVYGTYTFNFTREVSNEAEVQNSPNIYLISGGTVGSSINTSLGRIIAANIIYGNAPDLSKVTSAYGMFSANPTISKNATISSQQLSSSVINADGSRLYIFTFTVTAENGTVKNWELWVPTSAYNTTPAKIEVDYSGTTYFGAQVTDSDIMNEIFAMNKNQSGSYMVRYDVSTGNTGNNALYNILNNTNYTYELYRNNILIPASDYASYGITITKQAILGNYLRISIDALVSVPSGAYELRTYYTRPAAAISPSVTDLGGNTYSQFTWTEKIQYPSFYFFKAIGKKLSYATGLTLPYVPDTYSVKNGTTDIYWDGTNFDYTALGSDITTEERASYTHRQFDLSYKYKSDTFYYNFKPVFTLPDGATLYRQRGSTWEQVTASNLAADFSGGKSIRYRVYAEDTRFYNDYVITLTQVTKSKTFNVQFSFDNGAPNTIPFAATLKSLGMDSHGNYIVFGNSTVFSHPTTNFPLDNLPPGSYIFDAIVPTGYTATIVADNSPTTNDVTIGGKLLSGNWKMVTAMNDVPQTFNITVHIVPISNYTPPWGIDRQTRGS